ncbi:MAG: hypothetical protein IRZ10_03575 [Thermoflavifilum sp.]|nr:hypothetical protein [Thermoflavifilum sp.]MCL6513474.1 hypothetical protein [Alicyclobacillus sp.]
MSALVSRLAAKLNQADRQLSLFWRRRPMLAPAATLLTLVVWGGMEHDPLFVLTLAVVGALAYTTGLVVGFVASALGTVLLVALRWGHTGVQVEVAMANGLVMGLGLLLSAWMGYHHRRVREMARKWSEAQTTAALHHRPHVLPWAVANEIRTSLAAIRYLLFPVHGQADPEALQRATRELARLEALFDEWDPDKKRATLSVVNPSDGTQAPPNTASRSTPSPSNPYHR